jgi:hypothetical protein
MTVEQLIFHFEGKPIPEMTEQLFLDNQADAEKEPRVIGGKSTFALEVAERSICSEKYSKSPTKI